MPPAEPARPSDGREAVAPIPALAPPRVTSLVCDAVTCDFDRVRALHRVSFEAVPGEAIAVIGPNGAGKTTLLHVLATLQRPTSGRVVVDGQADAWRAREVVRAHVGLLAHAMLSSPELTGRETLELHGRLRSIDPATRAAWLAWARLGTAVDRPALTYSRGMKQRLAIARTLLHSPSIVLLDEPLTGLDRSSSLAFYALVRALREAGRIVIVITHSLDAPPDVFDRALVLERGRLVRDVRVEGSLLACWEAAWTPPPGER